MKIVLEKVSAFFADSTTQEMLVIILGICLVMLTGTVCARFARVRKANFKTGAIELGEAAPKKRKVRHDSRTRV